MTFERLEAPAWRPLHPSGEELVDTRGRRRAVVWEVRGLWWARLSGPAPARPFPTPAEAWAFAEQGTGCHPNAVQAQGAAQGIPAAGP